MLLKKNLIEIVKSKKKITKTKRKYKKILSFSQKMHKLIIYRFHWQLSVLRPNNAFN